MFKLVFFSFASQKVGRQVEKLPSSGTEPWTAMSMTISLHIITSRTTQATYIKCVFIAQEKDIYSISFE